MLRKEGTYQKCGWQQPIAKNQLPRRDINLETIKG
jgi:hypothetical protein